MGSAMCGVGFSAFLLASLSLLFFFSKALNLCHKIRPTNDHFLRKIAETSQVSFQKRAVEWLTSCHLGKRVQFLSQRERRLKPV